ncbi:MAG: hypothetical protein HN383_12545 [Verrucomicrobia bacterium]|jgi:hypothetical protein|nr:hypothetical protein [Verrucomicrobiota bacterium]MBT7700149.1 hypothetical protein [Verrucomicrobiota bacterium]
MMRSNHLLYLCAVLSMACGIAAGKDEGAGAARAGLSIPRIEYVAELSRGEASVEARVTVVAPSDDELSVLLFEGAVAVLDTKLPSGLRIERRDKQYWLVTQKRGRHELKIPLLAKVEIAPPWLSLSFMGPQAVAIASVDAEVSDDEADLELLSGVYVAHEKQSAQKRVRGFLGADRRVALRWRSGAREVARECLMTCDTKGTATLDASLIRYTTRLNLEVLQGATKELTVSLPAGQVLTDIKGDGIKDWSTREEGGRSELHVELVQPLKGSYLLEVATEQTAAVAPSKSSVALPEPGGVDRETGSLNLLVQDVTLEVAAVKGFRQVDAEKGSALAYRFHTRPAHLEAAIERVESMIRVTDRVYVSVEDTRFLETHGLDVYVEKAGIHSLKLALEDAASVVDVTGSRVEDWHVGDEGITVDFNRRILGRCRVVIQREMPLSTFPVELTVRPIRVVGADDQQARIGVKASPGIRLQTATISGTREIPPASLDRSGREVLGYRSEAEDWLVVLKGDRLASRLMAEVFNLVTVGDGQVSGSAVLRFAILNQGVQELNVQVPDHWKNVDFVGRRIRQKSKEGNTWRITLQDKMWGGYPLLMTYDYPFDPHQATLQLGGVHALGVERESGIVAVNTAPGLQLSETMLKAELPAQMLRIHDTEIPEIDRALSTRPIVLAYRYSGSDYELAVDVTRYQQLPVLQAVADRTQLSTVLTHEGQLLTQASYAVKNNDKQFQRFVLPEGAEFWACSVDSRPVKPEQDGDAVLIPLPRGGSRDRAFSVDIVYAQHTAPLRSHLPRSVRLRAPETDIQTTYAEWELYVPATHDLSRFSGNMVVAAGTTYGLDEAWSQFTRFYDNLYSRFRGLAVAGLVFAGFIALIVLSARRHWRGLAALCAVGFVVLILAGMLLPAVSNSRERARRVSSMSNLSQLGKAMAMYSMDNSEQLPDSLDALTDVDMVQESLLSDPVSGLRYEYTGGGRSMGDLAADAIVAYAPTSSGGGRNVLMTDGSVTWMNDSDFTSALAQMVKTREAGQIVAPAAPVALEPAVDQSESQRDRIRQKMESIKIPEIDFRQANIHDVIDFLEMASVDFDASDAAEDEKGLNIILSLGQGRAASAASDDPFAAAPAPAVSDDPFAVMLEDDGFRGSANVPLITFTARHISVMEALRIVTQVANLKYRIEGSVVMVVPFNSADGEIVVRMYDVQPGLEEKISTLGAEMSRSAFGNGSDFIALEGQSVSAGGGDWRTLFTDMGVQWPDKSSVKYVRSIGKLVVANTEKNMAVMEDVLETLSTTPGRVQEAEVPVQQAMEAAPLSLAGSASAAAAGVQSVDVDIPRSGERFVFTKVLATGGDALEVSGVAMPHVVGTFMKGFFALVVFVMGILLLWWRRRRQRVSSILDALGIVMIAGSVVGVLLVSRLLGVGMIAAAPIIGLVVLVTAVKRIRRARQSDLPPPPPHEGMSSPSAIAPLLLAGALALYAQAAAGALVVSHAEYTGAVRSDVAEIDVSLECVVTPGTQDVSRLRLFGLPVAVSEFKASRRGVELGRDADGVFLHCTGRGDVTASMKLLVSPKGDAKAKVLDMRIPMALSSRVDLTFLESDADVKIPDAVTLRRLPAEATLSAGSARVQAVLGATDRLKIEWEPRVRRAEDVAAMVFCESHTLVHAGGGGIRMRTRFAYQISQGLLEEARVLIPAGQQLLKVTGKAIERWEAEAQADGSVVSVKLLEGVADTYELVIDTEYRYAALPASVALMFPQAVGVQRQAAVVALSRGEDIALAAQMPATVKKIDITAATWKALATDLQPNIQSVHRLADPACKADLAITAVEPRVQAVVHNQFRMGEESQHIAARVEYTIKEAGVFGVALSLPQGFTVTSLSGSHVLSWKALSDADGSRVRVKFSQRILGQQRLDLVLYRWVGALAESVSFRGVYPVGAEKVTGFVKVGADLGLAVHVSASEGLTEVPANSVRNIGNDGGALAYKFTQVEPSDEAPWNLLLKAETVPSWVRAEVVNRLVADPTQIGIVRGVSSIRYDIHNAPVKQFRIEMPEDFRNVEITGKNIRRKENADGVWTVSLQEKVSGIQDIRVEWERSFDIAEGGCAVRGPVIRDVERETGYFAIFVGPPLQVEEGQVGSDVIKADVSELPEWGGSCDDAALAYRYLKAGSEVGLKVTRYDHAAVLGAIADSAHFRTVVAEDGQLMTSARLSVQNTAFQYLELALPENSELWSAFVSGVAIQPNVDSGKVMLPLKQVASAASSVDIDLVYIGTTKFPERKGAIAIASPSLGIPVKDARWDLYLPPGYVYTGFGGSMQREETTEGEAVQSYSFSMSDYSRVAGKKAAARKAKVSMKLKWANEALDSESGKNVAQYQQVLSEAGGAASSDHEVTRLKKKLRDAQAVNMLKRQESFSKGYAKGGKTAGIEQRMAKDDVVEQLLSKETAARQWDRLQRAQEIGEARIRPIHVVLPQRGIKYTFTQPLQSKPWDPMTIKFSAARAGAGGVWGWVGTSVVGFLVIWLAVAAGRRRQDG